MGFDSFLKSKNIAMVVTTDILAIKPNLPPKPLNIFTLRILKTEKRIVAKRI
jgi:hypothetical protein